jgi:hypothetical protein
MNGHFLSDRGTALFCAYPLVYRPAGDKTTGRAGSGGFLRAPRNRLKAGLVVKGDKNR